MFLGVKPVRRRREGQACDLGDAQGCYNAGLMADEGRGGARDLSRAAARYDEGCALGSATACTNLGFLYENGREYMTRVSRVAILSVELH